MDTDLLRRVEFTCFCVQLLCKRCYGVLRGLGTSSNFVFQSQPSGFNKQYDGWNNHHWEKKEHNSISNESYCFN